MTPLSLLLACSAIDRGIELGGQPPLSQEVVDDTGERLGGEDSGEGTDTGEEEEPESWPQDCADLYDPEVLQTIELEFEPAEWNGLRSDCAVGIQAYRPVDFTIGGETVPAMARLKGNWSWSCDKPQFVISFNEVDPEGRFHGLRKMMLDAPWYDRTLLHERLAFPFFAKRGLPYSCVNSARLLVNGDEMGVYSNVERIDHEYLERHFEESDGNLYQGGAELKTNEDVADASRLEALRAARSAAEIAELVDLDQAVAEWAAEAILPALDNFWAGVEINYYLYDHPSRGFLYLPYDLDISFGDSAYTSGDLIWPNARTADPITYEHTGWRKEDLMKLVLSDASWCQRFVEELVLARADFFPSEMGDQVDAWEAQIAEAVAADPNQPFSTSDHTKAVRDLKTFLDARAAFVDVWLAEPDHCPARW